MRERPRTMSPMERFRTALALREPDRVPLCLLFACYGAKEMGVSIEEYFRHPLWVAEGQMRLQRKFGHDSLFGFFYASAEVEAWGMESIFSPDGPPNSGTPIIRTVEDIAGLGLPRIGDCSSLTRTLETIALLREEARGEIPIVAVANSPLAQCILQMGFDLFIRTLFERPDALAPLLQINTEFCIRWANAQLEAGATAITLFSPLASSEMIPAGMYRTHGLLPTREAIRRIQGPTIMHLATAKASRSMDLVREAGTLGLGFSSRDIPGQLLGNGPKDLFLLGGLDGINLPGWTRDETDRNVRESLAGFAPGGGFALASDYVEILWQTPERVVFDIVEAMERYGSYPSSLKRQDETRECP